MYDRYERVFRKYFVIDGRHRAASHMKNNIEILGQRKDRDIVPLEISFGNSKSVLGERILTCIVRDITERKKTERKLRYLAYHDKATALGNRDLFYITLEEFLAAVKRYKGAIGALLFLDLDGFKKINDTLGHHLGDKILFECARRLSNCLRESDHIYRPGEDQSVKDGGQRDLFRFGGDEFVILLTHLRQSTDAAIIAQKIIDSIQRPYYIKGYESISKVSLGVSIGIAIVPDNGKDATTLISSADVAMYKAKEMGNRYIFFTSEMNERATERLLLEAGIRNALEKNHFVLYYQPLVAPDGKIKGMESLIRWRDPKQGLVSPGKFIPIAEETSLIIPIGDWIMKACLNQLRHWSSTGFDNVYVSMNLSVKQFNQVDIVEKLTKTIRQTSIDPRYLRLEITESSIMSDPSEARAKMDEIKKLNPGVRIAIDDFGTGYSSLSYLSEYPVDILKIDQSFISNLDRESNKKIVNTIITLAHSLNMEVVAEGVETKEQAEYLTSKKCGTLQGYYYGKPVPAGEMVALLEKGTLP